LMFPGGADRELELPELLAGRVHQEDQVLQGRRDAPRMPRTNWR
jgi:hypothetical protein